MSEVSQVGMYQDVVETRMWVWYAIFPVFQEKPEIQIIVLNCWQLVKFLKNFCKWNKIYLWMMTPDMQGGQAL